MIKFDRRDSCNSKRFKIEFHLSDRTKKRGNIFVKSLLPALKKIIRRSSREYSQINSRLFVAILVLLDASLIVAKSSEIMRN